MANLLTKEEACFSLINNFFPENISKDIFSTKEVFKYLKDNYIDSINSGLKVKNTTCAKFSIYKSETERRILGIPHITTYILLVDYISKNFDMIYKKIIKNKNSNSKFLFMPYEIPESFDEVLKKKIWDSIGNKYILSLDISRCYENIYTHSITWALLGKEKAKEEFVKKERERNILYNLADELDKKVRSINNDETKGIPTGPLTSRLISELILAEIDKILKEKFPNIKYNRYVDDYKFYFLKKEEAIQFIPKFQNILYDFKFSLNQNKTKIDLFPNGIFSEDLRSELSNYDFEKNSIPAFIKKFMSLHNSGVKGAFKYGLKVLTSHSIENKDKKYVLACLVNSLMIFPMTTDTIITIFEKNNLLTSENKKQITNILNKILLENIKNEYEEEIFWNLYFLIKFQLEIDVKSIEKILDKMEVFSTIITIDYIFNKKLNKNNTEIKNKLQSLREKLQKKTIYSEEWLLIYECAKNDWIKGLKNIVNTDPFLKKFLKKGEKFYTSPLRD